MRGFAERERESGWRRRRKHEKDETRRLVRESKCVCVGVGVRAVLFW